MSAEFESWRSHRESILKYPRETKHVSLRLQKKNKILWAGKSQFQTLENEWVPEKGACSTLSHGHT